MAFGPMHLTPAVFWRMTLAEWRAMVDGYGDCVDNTRRHNAWVVSHLLVAAGCKPEQVTVAKLLGEKEPKSRKRDKSDIAPEDFDKAWSRGSEVKQDA